MDKLLTQQRKSSFSSGLLKTFCSAVRSRGALWPTYKLHFEIFLLTYCKVERVKVVVCLQPLQTELRDVTCHMGSDSITCTLSDPILQVTSCSSEWRERERAIDNSFNPFNFAISKKISRCTTHQPRLHSSQAGRYSIRRRDGQAEEKLV